MKRLILFFMAASVLAAVSCTKEADNNLVPETTKVAMTFDASIGAQTKVELGASTDDGYKVLWSVDDAITVVAHDNAIETGYVNGNKFTTELTAASSAATFSGESEAGDEYYAAYPYNANTRWYYTYKDFSIPFKANQVANGLKNGILVAKASNGSLDFAHVCGYVKFTIPNSFTDIAEVRFSGNNSEVLASQYVYAYPEDMSLNKPSGATYTELSLTPSSDTFVPGTYYLTVLPVSLTKGLTITFVNSTGQTASKSTDETKPAVIKAGDILNLGEISGLNFEVSSEATYTFDFTDPSSLNITPPTANSSGTDLSPDTSYGTGDIIMTVTNASNATRIWKTTSGVYELRTYKNGGSLKFTAPSGKNITKVKFVGAKINVFNADSGTYSNGEWTGSANSVKFTATGTANIDSATITYE